AECIGPRNNSRQSDFSVVLTIHDPKRLLILGRWIWRFAACLLLAMVFELLPLLAGRRIEIFTSRAEDHGACVRIGVDLERAIVNGNWKSLHYVTSRKNQTRVLRFHILDCLGGQRG